MILSKLPGYVSKHYFYFREKFAELIPNVNISGIRDDSTSSQEQDTSNEKIQSFYTEINQMLEQVIVLYNEDKLTKANTSVMNCTR
jgi:hypothetical protein